MGAMPTLVVGMSGNTGKQDMPTTSVGMAPIGNHLPQRILQCVPPGEDFAGELLVVLGAVGVGCVLEDGLAETGRLGQPDVAADPGLEGLGVGPGRRPLPRTV